MADYKKSMEMLGRIVDLNRPPAPQRIIRASDAFSPFIDKSVGVTMADRTKAEQFGKFKGGARFPWLQNVDPAYEGQTWGFGKKGMATRMHGQFEAIPEEELLISTILGKKDMLKSNPEVFADLVKQYKKGMKSGLLTDELRVKTNKALAGIQADDTGKLMFGPDVDIADPAFFKSLDTFDKRREVGNILGGVGVGGKKGQLFDYDAAIKKYTEPSLHEAPNMSIGPRIFTLSGTKAERPDLNAAYPHVVGGLDLGIDYTPVPRNIFLKDYHDEFMSRGKVPGWYNITQSSSMPYQKITDEWLQHLKDRGYAEGGEVERMQAGGIKKAIGALEELTQAAPKKITHSMLRRRGMGISSKDEADALYSSGHRIFGMHEMDEIPFEITDRALFDSYAPDLLMAYPPEHLLKKASGGDVEHMQSGGIKKAVGTMLSAAERDANLAKYMEGAAIPERLYHATTATQGGKGDEALRNLKPSKEGALGSGIYMTPSTDYANMYAQGEGGNVMPLFTNMRNPLKITGEHRDPMKEALIKLGVDPAKADTMVERAYETNGYIGKQVQSRAQAQGFDGIAQYKDGDLSEVVAFNPNSVKSAIGNTGEYMPYSGLLGKAEGGSVEHMQMGGLKGMVGAGAKLLPKAERDAKLVKFLESSAVKDRLYHATGQDFTSFDASKASPESKLGEGIYMTPDTKYANFFANIRSKQGDGAQIMPVYTSVKNPYVIEGTQNIPLSGIDKSKLQSLGYDGILFRNDAGEVKEVVAFEPTQVKSAIGNQGTYDVTNPDITKAQGGQVEHMQSGGLKGIVGAGMKVLPEVENAIANIKEANRISIVPMPNRWFMQPDKFPQMQGLVEKVLQRSGLPRESFTSGAYANPITGEILDRKIFEDVGVAINPQTNRPMMSAGKEAGIEELEKELGGMTRSNLVRKGLFKRTGGDSLLDDINFLATIERSGMGHKYGLSTEYGSPTQMFNTGKSGNPTLRPTSRGDVFGVGDVVGQIQLGKGPMHDVYEKLFVAPQGMDVPGVKLHKGDGGMAKTPVGGEMKHTSFQELRDDMGMADGGDIMHKLVKYAAAGGEIDDLQHSMAKQYLETLNG